MAHENVFCSVEKWCYNHFTYDKRSSLTGRASLSHFRPTCTLWTRREGPSSLMVLGRCVPWVVPVMPFTTRSSCSSNRDTLCSSVMQENVVCTDCIYTRWNTFASEGSNIADVVNYCVSSSPLPSPSPSPSLRQVCVMGW